MKKEEEVHYLNYNNNVSNTLLGSVRTYNPSIYLTQS